MRKSKYKHSKKISKLTYRTDKIGLKVIGQNHGKSEFVPKCLLLIYVRKCKYKYSEKICNPTYGTDKIDYPCLVLGRGIGMDQSFNKSINFS